MEVEEFTQKADELITQFADQVYRMVGPVANVYVRRRNERDYEITVSIANGVGPRERFMLWLSKSGEPRWARQ